ncbi:hypothetical protein MTR67_034456 [Solanum verrucosum]|uniref:Uncharacterized protein n=1 Tax=Solanum verrucosum TaxID=315347 RepID=A0AAF0ZIP8_SOLVR|nr:hypothetical protein MTR67_034456 [Solanum verrucosum]
MLVNDINNSRLMVHSKQIEEDKLKERSREAKRAKIVMVASHIQGLMGMVALSFDRGFPAMVPPMLLLSSTKIGGLAVSVKEEMVGDLHCLLVPNVERSMRVGV